MLITMAQYQASQLILMLGCNMLSLDNGYTEYELCQLSTMVGTLDWRVGCTTLPNVEQISRTPV